MVQAATKNRPPELSMGTAFDYGAVRQDPARYFLEERRDAQAERTTKGDRTALLPNSRGLQFGSTWTPRSMSLEPM